MSKPKTILITRPLIQAENFKARLESEVPECEGLISPVLEISYHHVEITPKDFDALILTSVNALSVIEKQPFFDFTIPLLCVGKKTAQMAKEAGFTNIKYAVETSSLLNDFIIQNETSFKSALYLRGKHISFDFKTRLADINIELTEYIVYEAVEITELPETIIKKLKASKISAVTFFSRRSAEHFCNLLKAHNIPPEDAGIAHTKALCIAQGVVEYLSGYFDSRVYVSRTPDENGMIELISSKA